MPFNQATGVGHFGMRVVFIIRIVVVSSIIWLITEAGLANPMLINHQIKDTGTLVQIGSKGFTIEEFKNYVEYHPFPSHIEITTEVIKRWLEEIIVSEILYQEAITLGLDKDPTIHLSIQQILTQRLMEEKVEKPIWNKEITDQEIEEYFNKHEYQFNRPAEVRVADIFIAVKDPSEITARLHKAKQVLAEAKEIEGKGSGFGHLIRRYSERHDNYPLGDPGYFDKEGSPVKIEKEVATIAFQLKIGEIYDEVIKTARGFHIIMLIGRRPEMKTDWKQKRYPIQQQIRLESLETSRKEFISKLKEKTKIEMNEERITILVEELNKKREVDFSGSKGELRPPALP